MTEFLTAAQMRASERAVIEAGGATGLALMERAGRGVVEAVLAWRPGLALAPGRAVVLCGPGNNGGDGFVIARLLRERGWEIDLRLFGDAETLPPDAAENYTRWRQIGPVRPYRDHDVQGEAQVWRESALIIDALFGTGLTRPVTGFEAAGRIMQAAGHAGGGGRPGIVAVDLPSGLCADSGRFLDGGEGEASTRFRADLTVTFHARKLGHVLAEGPAACGAVRVVDIGLGCPVIPGVVEEARAGDGLAKGQGHKYGHGHAMILAGGVGRGGAARLAARGALRIGAGLVTVAPPPSALIENAARLDAIMLAPVADAEAVTAEMAGRKINAVCVGPGLGLGERARALVAATLAARVGTVLDADALTVHRDDPAALFAMLHDRCVLTPHDGEFGRLFPDIRARLEARAARGPAYSRVDAAREAARRAGAVVLLKGADTVIADPSGRCVVSAAHDERAAPWLATAGSGDVLAGFITGLLARGVAPMEAAATAAWLHVECARRFGPGLIAEDLPEALPRVFRDLGI